MQDWEQVRGFRWAGAACGIKASGAADLALLISEHAANWAGVFTTNQVKAASVKRNMALFTTGGVARVVVANSGNANASTGSAGDAAVLRISEAAADAVGCNATEVLTLSTGVIGVPLPDEKISGALPLLVAQPGTIQHAAEAILTTDRLPKLAGESLPGGLRIAGIAKGSGMIAPNMATMLCIIATDARVSAGRLRVLLREAAKQSFNHIVVDGDMSTNDTVLLLANGASGIDAEEDPDFAAALARVCESLAKQMVMDGEGATRFVEVVVEGAASEAEAEMAARAICTSPLCKTAFYGADPNWGRILAAAGRSGAQFDPEQVALWFEREGQAIQMLGAGQPLDYDEATAIELMQGRSWGIRLKLGEGAGAVTLWTCDLSHEYVTINGHYRT